MFKKMRTSISLILVLAVLFSFGAPLASATELQIVPFASSYLDSYSAYVYSAGSKNVQVWFTVTGCTTVGQLGALTVILQESTNGTTWQTVKTFSYVDYPGILAYNTGLHSGSVSYSGISGRYYKAYVTVWGGTGNNGDSRQIATGSLRI